jgi:hypothetical protein
MSASYFASYIGPGLQPSDYCDRPNLKKSLLLRHRISEDDLNFRIELFFDSAVNLQPIAIADIKTYMSGKSCGVNFIDLVVNFNNVSNNNEIALQQTPTRYYEFSFAFFQAILDKFDVNGNTIKEFQFSKAVSEGGNIDGNSVVLRVVNMSGQTLYCADFSGVHP